MPIELISKNKKLKETPNGLMIKDGLNIWRQATGKRDLTADKTRIGIAIEFISAGGNYGTQIYIPEWCDTYIAGKLEKASYIAGIESFAVTTDKSFFLAPTGEISKAITESLEELYNPNYNKENITLYEEKRELYIKTPQGLEKIMSIKSDGRKATVITTQAKYKSKRTENLIPDKRQPLLYRIIQKYEARNYFVKYRIALANNG